MWLVLEMDFTKPSIHVQMTRYFHRFYINTNKLHQAIGRGNGCMESTPQAWLDPGLVLESTLDLLCLRWLEKNTKKHPQMVGISW